MNPQQQETDFYNHLQNAPFSDEGREQLMIAERWLSSSVSFPPISSFYNVFGPLEDPNKRKVSIISDCLSRALYLDYTSMQKSISNADKNIMFNVSQLYISEAQRLLGSVFPLDNPFWKTYYIRFERTADNSYASILSISLLPLDILHHLSKLNHQIEYELLLQSMNTLIKCIYPESPKTTEDLSPAIVKRALRITARLNLPEYELWAMSLSNRKSSIP